MQIDMGFSDEIVPPANTVTYPTILPEMPSPTLQGYPKEVVVSEKLHCIVVRGSINSRMKDFYDLWFIAKQFDFVGVILQNAIISTFKNRETPIPNDLPVGLSDDYANEKKRQWQAFLNTFNPGMPDVNDFLQVIHTLRDFLIPVMKAISEGMVFNSNWKAGGDWSTSFG